MPSEKQGSTVYISGEALKQRFGGDRIVLLTPEGMRTVTDNLIIVEKVQETPARSPNKEAVA